MSVLLIKIDIRVSFDALTFLFLITFMVRNSDLENSLFSIST